MLNLIRTDYQLGNSKTIVGNINLDLVLETLGKVYIKSGKNLKLLLDVIGAVSTSKVSKSNIIFVNSTAELEALLTTLNYPGDGVFVFNLVTKVLSLTVNNTLIPLIDADINDPNKLIYVQKSGDTMTGLLEINVRNLPPLIVKSDLLVSNLNSNYLEGYSGNDVAIKKRNEYLSGEWTFGNKCQSLNKWIFKDTVTHHKDIITNASIGTPLFYPGFSGSGWRLDGTTNTLTIDNLVVRKLMQVYEMVINKIRATNGSLWVTDSDKCSKSEQLIFVDDVSTFDITNVPEGSYVVFPYLDSDNTPNITTVTVEGSSLGTNQSIGSDKNFIRFHRMFHIINPLSIRAFVSEHITLNNDTINQLVNDFITTYIYKDDIDVDVIQRIKDFYYPIDLPTEGDEVLSVDITVPEVIDGTVYNMNVYYKYFGCELGNNNYYIINTEENYPVFRVGDIVRCQKVISTKEIKYYDLIVHYIINDHKYLVLIATSVLDLITSIEYDEEGNLIVTTSDNNTPYTKGIQVNDKVWNSLTNQYDTIPRSKLGSIEKGDELVRVGNIQNKHRQGAVYITSSDDQAPYIDVLADLNRPDYSVLYKQPIYITYKKWKYVGTVENGGTYLGKFHKDVNTNEIIKPYTLTGESDPDDVVDLYGYECLNLNCLILHKKVLTGEEDGNPIYSYIPVYDYTKSVRARLGKLDGIYDYRLGNNQPHGYGLYSDNVFLTGEFYLNNGKSIASFADDITLLSGKIESIDLDALKQSIIDAVENLIPDKESLGIAGIMTYPLEGGRHGLAVLGDLISFWDSKTSIETGDPTMLILNGKINANLIDVKELEFDKLVGKGLYLQSVVKNIEMSGTLSNINNEQKTFTNALVVGTPKEITNTLYAPNMPDNAITKDGYKRILHLKDFYILYDRKYYRIYLAQVSEGELMTFKYVYLEEESPKYISIPENITQVDESTILEVQFDSLTEIGHTEYDLMHINSFGKGEQILSYPDGTVMNAKIITKDSNGHPKSCIEYFFSPGVITEEDLLNKGDTYVVKTFMYDDEFSENYTGGLLKRINYFAKNTIINYETVNMWDYLLSDWLKYYWYVDDTYTTSTYSDMYTKVKDMKRELQSNSDLGKYSTDYGNFLAAIRNKRLENNTLQSLSIIVGNGEDLIQWSDTTTTFPGHYIYNDHYALKSYIEELLSLGTTKVDVTKKSKLENYRMLSTDADNIVDILFVSDCTIKSQDNKGNACSITITYIKQHDTPDKPNCTIFREDIVFELDKDGNYVKSIEIGG